MAAYKPEPGEAGWSYQEKGSEKVWTYGEIAALFGGNEYMTDVVCNCMTGQDPVACRDALVEHGAIRKLDDGGYAFTYYDPEEHAWDVTDVEVEALVDFWLPKPPMAYDKETKNGYTILERFEQPSGRLDVLAAKQMMDGHTEYVVAHGYDMNEGDWSHGTYRDSFAEAGVAWEEAKGSREPSELKSAGKAPKQKAVEVATPGKDGKVCSASATSRGVDAPSISRPERLTNFSR